MTINSPTLLQQILQTAKASQQLSGHVKFNEPMSRSTTWRIGGNAECVYQPDSEVDLQNLLKLLPSGTPVNWVGLGSNLLIRDGGLKGIVIYTKGVFNNLEIDCSQDAKGNCIMTAQAGLACAIFSRKAASEGINGAEFFSGIPGTIGGALAMNAGAFGGETWRNIISVRMINRNGEIITRTPDEFDIQYRHIKLNKETEVEWFLNGRFCFKKDAQGLEQSKQEIKRLLAKRAATQPTKQASAGSVFKNPANDYAARLIEASGLKGETINDAQISPKHANFIINRGQAQAKDVEALIAKIQNVVLEEHQIALETEIRILGDEK